MATLANLSVAVPTYNRDDALVRTIELLRRQEPRPAEILVMDQTQRHTEAAEASLDAWNRSRAIRWERLTAPSIPRAMNHGLLVAASPIILFLDDDILPAPNLIKAHWDAYGSQEQAWAVAGQVLQPEEVLFTESVFSEAPGQFASLAFPFNSTSRCWVKNVMAGNLSVRRDKALEIGGFDENFVGVAYRFETEFCARIWKNGGRVLFEPSASIRHLREPQGGTRHYGNHLTSASPAHGVGDYYFALRQGLSCECIRYMARRPFREVFTRFHLWHPWWIPVKFLGEWRAFWLALGLQRQGPKLIGARGEARNASG